MGAGCCAAPGGGISIHCSPVFQIAEDQLVRSMSWSYSTVMPVEPRKSPSTMFTVPSGFTAVITPTWSAKLLAVIVPGG